MQEATVAFRCGDDIDQREAGVRLLQKYWKTFAPKDVLEWGQRIANSDGYIANAGMTSAASMFSCTSNGARR